MHKNNYKKIFIIAALLPTSVFAQGSFDSSIVGQQTEAMQRAWRNQQQTKPQAIQPLPPLPFTESDDQNGQVWGIPIGPIGHKIITDPANSGARFYIDRSVASWVIKVVPNSIPRPTQPELPPLRPKLGRHSTPVIPSIDPATVVITRINDPKKNPITRNEDDNAYIVDVRVSVVLPGKKPIIKEIDIEIPDESIDDAIANKAKGDPRTDNQIIADFIAKSIEEAALEAVGIAPAPFKPDTPSPFSPSGATPPKTENPKDAARREQLENKLEELERKNVDLDKRERALEE